MYNPRRCHKLTSIITRTVLYLWHPVDMQTFQIIACLQKLQNQQFIEASTINFGKTSLNIHAHHPELRGTLNNITDPHQQYYQAKKVTLSVTDTTVVSCIVGLFSLVVGCFLFRKFCTQKPTGSRDGRQYRITATRAEVVRLQNPKCTNTEAFQIDTITLYSDRKDSLQEDALAVVEPATILTVALIV